MVRSRTLELGFWCGRTDGSRVPARADECREAQPSARPSVVELISRPRPATPLGRISHQLVRPPPSRLDPGTPDHVRILL